MAVPPSAKRMLRVVYIMGVILVLLFLTLVATIIWKVANRPAVPPVPPVPQPSALSLGLPQGTDLRDAQLDGDRLIINTGREIIVIDLRKNAITARISASP